MCIVLAGLMLLAGADGRPGPKVMGSQLLVPFVSAIPARGASGWEKGSLVSAFLRQEASCAPAPHCLLARSLMHRRDRRCQRNKASEDDRS